MNIKRFALVLVILFAAPFAAFGDIQFTDQVIRDDNAPLLQRLREIQSSGILPMTAPTSTRVDVAIMRPDTWSPSLVSETLAEVGRADERLHRILHNSNIDWLTFSRVAVVTYHPTGSGIPPTHEQMQAVRVQTGADRIVAIVDEYSSGGSAMLCGPYAVARRSNLYEAYAHELFHTVCLDHEPETAGTPPIGFENNRAMYVCPEDGSDGFGAFMTQSTGAVACGWYDAERLTGPGVFYNGVELVGEYQQATLILQVAAPLAAAEMNAPLGPCVPDDTTMCLDSSNGSGDKRFEVRIAFDTALGGGRSGFGRPTMLPTSTESGLFSFFAPSNLEMLIKVINGCGSNNSFWIFFGTTTTVGFELEVRDTVLQNTWSFTNPDNNQAKSAEISALPCN